MELRNRVDQEENEPISSVCPTAVGKEVISH
jgi:hypothetical protein